MGHLPADAPTTLRLLGRVTGQLTCEQLVDRHGVASAPIRGLLIDYLEERRHRLDYSTLDNLARNLTRNFWSDLERHHPGIASLDLAPEVVTAWKERLHTRIQRRKCPDGTVQESVVERADRGLLMMTVRAFYSGLPPHIAQVIVGHTNINTTMGYNAVYPTETIEAHRAFITRRRTLRPAEDYRTPTEAEWEDFLGHFERRKLSVGT
ncbi:hypothetical protein ACFPH6_30130 [Streptomyces xiangluensis]|uniref:Phage integrase family protein n=1 Tax=Streptomyces xiangluensis TaxID=2665720 RepID=A0ABV8YWU7_9ACTN